PSCAPARPRRTAVRKSTPSSRRRGRCPQTGPAPAALATSTARRRSRLRPRPDRPRSRGAIARANGAVARKNRQASGAKPLGHPCERLANTRVVITSKGCGKDKTPGSERRDIALRRATHLRQLIDGARKAVGRKDGFTCRRLGARADLHQGKL